MSEQTWKKTLGTYFLSNFIENHETLLYKNKNTAKVRKGPAGQCVSLWGQF